MGFVAPVIGVVSAIGGAISASNQAASQNAANAMQIEANRREEKIRLLDVEAQRESNRMDFEVSSQQRVAALAAALSSANIQRLDAQTQQSIQKSQLGSARNALDVNAQKGEVSRESNYQNILAQEAQARGIDIQGVPYDALQKDVVTQRAALMAALNPMMADMYRTQETSNLLSKYDTLRSAEGDQKVQVDYANQYADLLNNYANITKQVGDTAASYQQVAGQNSLNATDLMQQNAANVNESLFGTVQQMQANNSQIDQLSAYRRLLAGENAGNAQDANIRSATSAKNAEVMRTNKNVSFFDYVAPIASAGFSLFNAFSTPQQQSSIPTPPTTPSLRVSDSRYDPRYNRTDFFG